MSRATQFTIGRSMIAVAIIAYFTAFPELAVLLGIFTVSLLCVAPVGATMYLVCRYSPGTHRSSPPRL